jgi:hypothetical protein
VFVFVSTECPVIGNPTTCKIHIAIHLLHAENMSAVEIRCELWMFMAKI